MRRGIGSTATALLVVGAALLPVTRVGAVPAVRAPSTAVALTFTGHGSGPGLGMGQWGAFGYAVRYHETYEQILDHYYGGTVSSSLSSLGEAPDPTIRVSILENVNLKTNVGYDTVVTSDSSFSVTSLASTETGAPTTTGLGAPTTAAPPTTGSGPAATAAPPTTTAPTTSVAPTSTSSPGGLPPSGPSASGATTALTVPPAISGATGSSAVTTVATPSSSPASTTTTVPPAGVSPSGPAAGSTQSLTVPAGEAVDLRLQANGTWNVYLGSSCAAASSQAAPAASGFVDPSLVPASLSEGAPVTALLTLCRHDGVDEQLRGTIEALDWQGNARTLNVLPLQSYLDGVVPAEESASWGSDGTTDGSPDGRPWGFQALESQAVAARSYALATAGSGGWNGYADICDTTQCQAYVGANYEEPLSDAAVSETLGEVRTTGTDPVRIVSTRYSASSGGWTAGEAFPAVRDLGDACVMPGMPLECNPVHSWTATVSARVFERHYPTLGGLVGLRVSQRNDRGAYGGRVLEVTLRGRRTSLVVSGWDLAAALGLDSDWFALVQVHRAPPAASAGPTGAVGPTGAGTGGTPGGISSPCTPPPDGPGPSGPVPTCVPAGVPSAPASSTAGGGLSGTSGGPPGGGAGASLGAGGSASGPAVVPVSPLSGPSGSPRPS